MPEQINIRVDRPVHGRLIETVAKMTRAAGIKVTASDAMDVLMRSWDAMPEDARKSKLVECLAEISEVTA